MTRIAVIGAGLAGLTAARALADRGAEVVVFEKSRGVGGRLATRRADGVVVDHGCPELDLPADGRLAALVAALAPEGRIALDAAPGRVRLTFADGMTRLAKAMAEGIGVVRGVRIAALRPVSGGLEVGDEQGNGHGTVAAAVVTAPAPQAAALLSTSGEPGRAAAVDAIPFTPAVCLLTEVTGDLPQVPAPEVVSAVGARPPGPDGRRGVAVRLDPRTSADLIDGTDEQALAVGLPALAAVTGGDTHPWVQVKRWRYALPDAIGDMSLRVAAGSRVILAGDSFTGVDLEAVHGSGLQAAAAAWRIAGGT